MARINLETYYKVIFKDRTHDNELLKEINRAHVISSLYYDVQFGRNTLLYRDKKNRLSIPIEHDLSHIIVVYLDYYLKNNKCDIDPELLKSRISKALRYLNVSHQYE